MFKLRFLFLLIFSLMIKDANAISTNPDCYTSSDLKITMDNLRLNENNQFLFKEPTNFQFQTWGRKLGKCQYKSMKDINKPIYTTFDSGVERGVIINGYKEGIWIEYFENTEIKKLTGKYNNSKKDGKWVEYDELGLVLNEIIYNMGVIVSENENIINANEVLQNTNNIEDNKELNFENINNTLFDNLIKINGLFFDPVKNIPVTTEFKSGSYLGKITNGYINEYPDTWTKIDKSGNIEYIGYFKNNLRAGDWIFYQNNSIYEKGSYSEGLKTDFWIKYYPNGNVLSRGAYSNDKQEGPWVYFNEDGSVLETGAYNNGIKTGPWLNLVTGTTTNYQ